MRALTACFGGGQGDRKGMKDMEGQGICDICRSAQQDEASYSNRVKGGQVLSTCLHAVSQFCTVRVAYMVHLAWLWTTLHC